MIFFICCLSGAYSMPAAGFFFIPFWNHYPLVVAVIVWIIYLKHLEVISGHEAASALEGV